MLKKAKLFVGLFCAAVVTSSVSLIASPATQPTGDEVINKYIEVTGGKAAYAKLKTRVMHATLDLPAQGMHGTIEVYSKDPNLLYVMVEIPGAEKKEDCFDGKIGWEKSAMQGTRILEGDELEQLKQQSEATGDLDWHKHYKSVENDGIVDLDGVSCYRLSLVNNAGKNETRYYDAQTGLLVQTEADAEAMGTKIHSISKVSDYRETSGIKVPFKTVITVKLNGMEIAQNLTIDKIETNVDIPDSKFAMPDDVKELLKDKETSKPSK